MPTIPTIISRPQPTRRRSRKWAVALVLVVGLLPNKAQSSELFAGPPSTKKTPDLTPPQVAPQMLPPVCNARPRLLDRRQNSLLPNSVSSPLESSLFFDCPPITRPLTGTPLLPQPSRCQPIMLDSPVSPGFQRSFGRYSLTSPVPPALVSAHAPPWEQLPTPAEHKGQVMQVTPHCSDERACDVPFTSADFSADPLYDSCSEPCAELNVYVGKYLNHVQRPAFEWGLPFFQNGPIPPSGTALGPTNLSQPKFYVYGTADANLGQAR